MYIVYPFHYILKLHLRDLAGLNVCVWRTDEQKQVLLDAHSLALS